MQLSKLTLTELYGVTDFLSVLPDKDPLDQQHGRSNRTLQRLCHPLGSANCTDFDVGVIIKGIHLG